MKDIKALFKFLLQIDEWESYVEFKENFDKKRDGKNISAISNVALLQGRDFWYMIFWVNDDKGIVGTSFKPNEFRIKNQDLKIWLAKMISPKVHLEFYEEIIEWKNIVILEIPSAIDTPIEFDRQAYIRIWESTTTLDHHQDLERKIWNNNTFFVEGLTVIEVLINY